MKFSPVIYVSALVAGATLAGCGDSPLTVQQQFDADLASAEAMAGRLDALSNSGFSIFTDAGEVTYNGYAVVGVDTADQSSELLGQARIVADFDTSTVTGSMTNFVGATAPLTQTTTPAAVPYSGTLTLTNGVVDGPNRPNQFGADFAGTLNGQGNVITFAGAMIGDFKGGPLRNGIIATSIDAATTTTLNGVAADGVVAVVAEADRDF